MSILPSSIVSSSASSEDFLKQPAKVDHGNSSSSSSFDLFGKKEKSASNGTGGISLNPLAEEFVPFYPATGQPGQGNPMHMHKTWGHTKMPSASVAWRPKGHNNTDPSSNAAGHDSVSTTAVKDFSNETLESSFANTGLSGPQNVDVGTHIEHARELDTISMGSSPSNFISGGRRGQNANYLLNFHYDPIVRPPPPRPSAPRRQRKAQPYVKELFLQANFKFLVSDLGDYMLNASEPDKMLQWEDIAAVEISTPCAIQCPICLESPLCAQITSCGHIFCFPCVLHYFMLEDEKHGDHYRKCPLCFAMTSSKELRTAIIRKVKQYSVGDKITFTLLTRAKASIIPLERNDSMKGALTYSKDGRCHRYSKFTLTSDADQITNKAISELTSWAGRAQSSGGEDIEQLPYVFAAIDLLKSRKVDWEEHRTLQFISSDPQVKQRILAQAKAGVLKLPRENFRTEDMASTHTNRIEKKLEMEVTDVTSEVDAAMAQLKQRSGEHESAFSDDDSGLNQVQEDVPSTWEELEVEQAPPKAVNADKDVISKKYGEESETYTFYQAVDGQPIILHPINMKCLLQHYGDYEALPSSLEGVICELETVTQTEATRKRFRYLSHLPLTTIFQHCELDLRPLLPVEAFEPFAEELRGRDLRRRRRVKQEKDLKAKEGKIAAAAAASIQRPPSPADFIAIMDAIHDEEVPTSLDFEETLLPIVNVPPPVPVEERKLFSSVTKLGFAAGHDAPDLTPCKGALAVAGPSESDHKGSPPTFADIIQAAKPADHDDVGSTFGGSTKKSKKGTKVLLSTAGGRRY